YQLPRSHDMLGDTLSDAAANLKDALTKHYTDEFANLPPDVQAQVQRTLKSVEIARREVDAAQLTTVLNKGMEGDEAPEVKFIPGDVDSMFHRLRVKYPKSGLTVNVGERWIEWGTDKAGMNGCDIELAPSGGFL